MTGKTPPAAATSDVRANLNDAATRREVELALRGIPGVLAARIVPGMEREIDELHVLTTLEKQPKSTVRDTISLLMARFGVHTDHRVISVVRLDEEESGIHEQRVRIGTVTTLQENLSCTIRVVLLTGEDVFEGEDVGPASPAGRSRAAARATLRALLPLLGESRVAEVEGVDVLDIRGHRVAMTFVHVNEAKGEVTLVGSAMVRNDELDAVARSVLDAANRMVATA